MQHLTAERSSAGPRKPLLTRSVQTGYNQSVVAVSSSGFGSHRRSGVVQDLTDHSHSTT